MTNSTDKTPQETMPMDYAALPEELCGGWWIAQIGHAPLKPYATEEDRLKHHAHGLADAVARLPRNATGLARLIEKDHGLVFIDLDGVRDPLTGETKEWAQKIIADLDTYTEISGSGCGFHLVARAKLVDPDYQKAYPDPDKPGHKKGVPVEIFYGYRPNKLFTLTGAVVPLYDTVNDRQRESENLLQRCHAGEFIPKPEVEDFAVESVPTIGELPKEPLTWVIDRLFLYGGLTVLCGKAGVFKSYFAMLAGNAISNGRPFLGRRFDMPREKGKPVFFPPVLYIDRENPASVVNERRERFGIIGNKDFHYWGPWFKSTPDPDDPRIMEFVKRRKAFVIFDSLQQWYGESSEIDNTAMLKLMNRFQTLARQGAGVLVLHHDAKFGDQGWRGATSIVNVPDMSIASRKSETGAVKLSAIRFRMCADWELDYRIDFGASDETHQLTVLNDQKVQQIAKQSAADRKQRVADEQEEIENLDNLLTDDPNITKLKIDEDHGIGRNRVEALAAKRGWKYLATGKPKWTKATDDPYSE